MQLLSKTLPVDHNLFLFGDLHIGSTLCHTKGIQKLINHMTSPAYGLPEKNNFGVCHGDNIEAIQCDDLRYDGLTVSGLPLAQAQQAIRTLDPIKDKLIVILEGNHEQKVWRSGRLAEHIASELNVPYGTYTCKITYRKRGGDVLYKHYATHGRRAINSAADDIERQESNMKLTLKRHLRHKAGDCALMSKGHTHRLLSLRPKTNFYLSDNSKEIQATYIKTEENAEYIHPDLRWYVNTGSFFKTVGLLGVSSYAEIAEYDPLECGYYVVLYRGGIQKIQKVVV